MEIRRGDIFYVENNRYTTGHEINGTRPAIVISNDIGNEHSSVVTVVWLTTQEKKPLPTHCVIKVKSVATALCEQISTISKERIGDYIRTASTYEMAEVDRCVRVSLGLESVRREVTVAEPYVYQESSTDDVKDAFEDLIQTIDGCYFAEANELKAEGIDIAMREVRKAYRRVLTEGV